MIDSMRTVLNFLASLERDETGDAWINGNDIHEGLKGRTDIIPGDINDSINLAENRGYVKVLKTLGTAPYKFHSATITAEGRLWLEEK